MKILQNILESVQKETGVDLIRNKSRKRHIVDAKRIYGYIARSVTRYSLNEIAMFINKDHATILHYVRTAGDFIATDKDFEALYYRCLKGVDKAPTEQEVLKDAFKYHLRRSRYYTNQLNMLNNGRK